MACLADYIDPESLVYYGFNYVEHSHIGVENPKGRQSSIYSAYFSPADKLLLIAESVDARGKKEWFFTHVNGMNNEDIVGPRQDEYRSIIENMVTRKNRIPGRALLERIEKMTGEPVTFSYH